MRQWLTFAAWASAPPVCRTGSCDNTMDYLIMSPLQLRLKVQNTCRSFNLEETQWNDLLDECLLKSRHNQVDC